MSKTAFPKLLFLIAITLLGTGAVIAQSQIGYGQEKEITNSIGQEKVSGTEKLIWPKRFLTPFLRRLEVADRLTIRTRRAGSTADLLKRLR